MIYKNILVAVDGSDTSKKALQEAIALANDQAAHLRLIHIVDEYVVDYNGLGIDYDVYEKSMKEYGQNILKQMEEIAKKANVNYDTKLIELKNHHSRVEQKIVEEAETWPADLIVIGTHGRRGFHHFLLGSVAEEVIRIAPVPVLLFREKHSKDI